jgi:tetratricopeptide (TPR) repeat protein
MSLIENNKTRALILIMCALVLSGIAISHFYYRSVNESVDPRIVEARKLYEKYNLYTQNNDLISVFYLMDSIEQVYASYPHYENSYEVGVLYNNRAATYITLGLFSDNIQLVAQDSLFNLAEAAASKSAEIYTLWLDRFSEMESDDIEHDISEDFLQGLDGYDDGEKMRFLKRRVKEIVESQSETPRRLSVSYTNLGVIYRQRQDYESAANFYKKAIDLWGANLTAENNLNILLGRPIKKRNLIQKLFPPERDQK